MRTCKACGKPLSENDAFDVCDDFECFEKIHCRNPEEQEFEPFTIDSLQLQP
jgi:hypothetical protein